MSRQGDRRRVARYVAARRGALNLTQEQLAARAGVDPKTVWNLETGARWPIAKNRTKIEIALGWSEGQMMQIANGVSPDNDAEAEAEEFPRTEVGRELLELFGTPEFEKRLREELARLPEGERSLVEEMYANILETQERHQRMMDTIVSIVERRRRRGEAGTSSGDDAAAG